MWQVLARTCYAKVPERQRDEEGEFEVTFGTWLNLEFVPAFKELVKARKRGSIVSI